MKDTIQSVDWRKWGFYFCLVLIILYGFISAELLEALVVVYAVTIAHRLGGIERALKSNEKTESLTAPPSD